MDIYEFLVCYKKGIEDNIFSFVRECIGNFTEKLEMRIFNGSRRQLVKGENTFPDKNLPIVRITLVKLAHCE